MPRTNDGLIEQLGTLVNGQTVTVENVPQELANGDPVVYAELNPVTEEAGAQLTPEMVDTAMEYLRQRMPEPQTMWAYPTAFAGLQTQRIAGDGTGNLTATGARIQEVNGRRFPYYDNYVAGQPRFVVADDIDEPDGHGLTAFREPEQPGWEQPGEDGVRRNRHGHPIVEVDLAGSTLGQRTLDYAYREVLKAASNTAPGASVELRIKRFDVSRMPRLIADTGVIYDLLVKMIDEREEAAGQNA